LAGGLEADGLSNGVDDAFIAEIRGRNDIVSVVGDYVSLKKAGTHFKGLCPFHGEKTPSFTVHPDRGFFYCFGCQAGGDVISFVRELNGYSFIEAIRHLAERSGMQVPERSFTATRRAGSHADGRPQRPPKVARELKDALYHAGGVAQRFFADTLQTMEGTGCRDYLRTRGVTGETIERFGLGYAPDRWDGLLVTLKDADVGREHSELLGLVMPKKSGEGHYDRFRNRLMFPIRSIAGEVIAFGGRTLSTDKEVAKYVNSPETPIYTKGDVLFGIHEARASMRKAQSAVIVEGNIDLLKLAQEGITNVVAPMGTALTEAQCRLLKRFVPSVVTIYDGDIAGRAAAEKAIAMALANGLQINVATLPMGEDPDTFVENHGVDELRGLITKAVSGWDYLLDTVVRETDAFTSPQGKYRAAKQLAPVIASVPDAQARAIYVRQLAHDLGLDERDLVPLLRDGRRQTTRGPEPPSPRTKTHAPPPPTTELEIVRLMMLAPELSALYMAHDVGAMLTHPGIQAVAEAWTTTWETSGSVDVASFIAGLEDPSIKDRLFRSVANAPPILDAPGAFQHLVKKLKRGVYERRLEQLKQEERHAYAHSDEDGAAQIQIEKLGLYRELERLKA
jgi:DNA primase